MNMKLKGKRFDLAQLGKAIVDTTTGATPKRGTGVIRDRSLSD
jgi:hypothetical protein